MGQALISSLNAPIYISNPVAKAATLQGRYVETTTNQAPQAVILAYQQLIQLNLELYKPEVADWLHSEKAEPVLKEMLVNVPCAGNIH